MSIKYVCDICNKDFDSVINDVFIDENKPNQGLLTFNVCNECKGKKLLKGIKRLTTSVRIVLPKGK